MQDALDRTRAWGADHVAVAVVGPGRTIATSGDLRHRFAWASVTKLVTAYAVLRAVDAGSVALEEPAGPPGATIRHLLAHASGLGFEGEAPISAPERTRIYSNPGYDLLGTILADREGRPFPDILRGTVLEPLGMAGTTLEGRPSEGLVGPLEDIVRFAAELLRPTLLSLTTFDTATHVVFPGLAGVLPGVARYDVLDWGLGFELRDGKEPHWTGRRNSPSTFGHIGGRGTMLWVDPDADIALACMTDRELGSWILDAWPALSDAVLEAAGATGRG